MTYVNSDKMVNKDKCQSIILNALRLKEDEGSASNYLREWAQIDRCKNNLLPNFQVLEDRFNDYKNYIGQIDETIVDRIEKFKENDFDEKVARGAKDHYIHHDQVALTSNLSPGSWVYYKFYVQSDKNSQFISIVSFFTGAIVSNTAWPIIKKFFKK